MLKTGTKPVKAGKNEAREPEAKAALERRKQEFEAWNSWIRTRSASATAIVVDYRPTIARYSVHKHGREDFLFSFGEPALRAGPIEHNEHDVIEDVDLFKQGDPLDVHQVLADFAKVGNLNEALTFLEHTGAFLPDGADFTWSEFQKWQRFARLVRERKGLEKAAQKHEQTGEAVEVLNAIEGVRDSAFFDKPTPTLIDTRLLEYPGAVETIRETEERRREQHKASCRWFREPPGTRKFVPRTFDPALEDEYARFGGTIEFLRPRNKLQQVFLIEPKVTVHAIAAAIYADWVTGVDYGKCLVCDSLFEIGTKKWQIYCSEKCNRTARMQRYRGSKKGAVNPEQKQVQTKSIKLSKRATGSVDRARRAPLSKG